MMKVIESFHLKFLTPPLSSRNFFWHKNVAPRNLQASLQLVNCSLLTFSALHTKYEMSNMMITQTNQQATALIIIHSSLQTFIIIFDKFKF